MSEPDDVSVRFHFEGGVTCEQSFPRPAFEKLRRDVQQAWEGKPDSATMLTITSRLSGLSSHMNLTKLIVMQEVADEQYIG